MSAKSLLIWLCKVISPKYWGKTSGSHSAYQNYQMHSLQTRLLVIEWTRWPTQWISAGLSNQTAQCLFNGFMNKAALIAGVNFTQELTFPFPELVWARNSRDQYWAPSAIVHDPVRHLPSWKEKWFVLTGVDTSWNMNLASLPMVPLPGTMFLFLNTATVQENHFRAMDKRLISTGYTWIIMGLITQSSWRNRSVD